MVNMYWEPLTFEIPLVPGRQWRQVIDTSAPSPLDIVDLDTAAFAGTTCRVEARTIVVLRD
jgi:glycogen operon protein